MHFRILKVIRIYDDCYVNRGTSFPRLCFEQNSSPGIGFHEIRYLKILHIAVVLDVISLTKKVSQVAVTN